MGKENSKKKGFEPHSLNPQEQLKFEIAQELGLEHKVLEGGWRRLTDKDGWRCLTSKESGRIGGLITKRKRQLRNESLKGVQ